MPVEIRELIIRAYVEPRPRDKRDQEVAPVCGPEQAQDEGQGQAQGQDAVVQACVKQVLQILKRSRER
jgi:hypothetical protein